MSKLLVRRLTIVAMVLAGFYSGCRPPIQELGDGFEVTYVDIVALRGIYYNRQRISRDLTIKSVKFDDSLILASGYKIIPNSNNVDTTNLLYYAICKPLYIKEPNQTKSAGYLGILSDVQYRNLLQLLKKPKSLSW